MRIPIACIWYDIDQNAPSRPFIAWIDSEDPIQGIASLLAQGDQTARITGPNSVDVTTPEDPEDEEMIGPETETVHLEPEDDYGDVAVRFDSDSTFFLAFPPENRDECMVKLGLI